MRFIDNNRMRRAFRIVFAAIALSVAGAAYAQTEEIDRYDVDFWYQKIGYQILSEQEKTVAVCQEYDYELQWTSFYENLGLLGEYISIPETVYDDKGTPYTVVALADGAIFDIPLYHLMLPESLADLNGGILHMWALESLTLPNAITNIEGLILCPILKELHIPENVETVKKGSMSRCGFLSLDFPQSLKAMEDNAVSECGELQTVRLQGVERLGKGCFNNCTSLTTVELPAWEINMDNCFNGCALMAEIVVPVAEPYSFPESCFKDADRATCCIVVPEGSVDAYRSAKGWKDFNNIREANPSGIHKNEFTSGKINVIGGKGVLSITTSSAVALNIYDSHGRLVRNVVAEGRTDIDLPHGLYIVTGGKSTFKTIVR